MKRSLTHRLSRFITVVAAALTLAFWGGVCRAAVTFVHVSDTHFPYGRSAERFSQMLSELESLDPQPSFIVHTGDITELGTREQVEGFAALLAPPPAPAEAGFVVPADGWRDRLYAVPGNHDVRWTDLSPSEFAALLFHGEALDRAAHGQLYYAFDFEGVHFIALDSSLPWEQHGMFDPQQVAWLRGLREAQDDGRPVVAFCHHPPILPEGNQAPGWDQAVLLGKDAGDQSPPVVVLCGHGHQTRAWRCGGATFVMTGGTYQDNAGYRVITVDGDRISSRLRRWANPEVALDEPLVLAERGREEYAFPSVAPLPRPAVADPPPGRVRWQRRLEKVLQAPPMITGDSVIVPTWAGVVELTASTGELIWQYDEASRALSNVAWLEGILYAPMGKSLVARRRGKVLWSFDAESEIRSPVIATADAIYTAAGRWLYAVDRATGEERWRYQAGGPIQDAIATTDDTVFVGAWDKRFRALDAATGEERWSVPIGDSFYRSPATGAPAVGDGKVIVTASQNDNVDGVTALDVATGEKLWPARVQAGYCTPVIVGERVYVTSLSGSVVCLSLADGTMIWEQALGQPIYDSSCAVAEGVVIAPGLLGTVFCLDAETGERLWSQRVTDGYLFARPAVGEGMAVVGAMDGTVTALELKP